MNYIKPFQKYISPMGAMGTIADSLGGSMPDSVGNLFDTVENAISDGVSTIVETFMGLAENIAGDTPLPEDFDMEIPSMDAIQNFLDAAGISNDLIDGVIDGVSSFVGENADDILGYTGLGLTLLSMSYVFYFGSGAGFARIGSLVLGSISVLTESVILLGSSFGWIGQAEMIILGTVIGFPAGIFTLVTYAVGALQSGTNPYEGILIAADVSIDFGGYVYAVNQAAG